MPAYYDALCRHLPGRILANHKNPGRIPANHKSPGRIPANHKNPQSREYLCTWDLPTTKQECYSFDYDFQFSRTTKNILHMLENR